MKKSGLFVRGMKYIYSRKECVTAGQNKEKYDAVKTFLRQGNYNATENHTRGVDGDFCVD